MANQFPSSAVGRPWRHPFLVTFLELEVGDPAPKRLDIGGSWSRLGDRIIM
jgi:hypothetical protein